MASIKKHRRKHSDIDSYQLSPEYTSMTFAGKPCVTNGKYERSSNRRWDIKARLGFREMASVPYSHHSFEAIDIAIVYKI